ncbi:MAG: alpha/beta hydrolase, partial [Thermoleophilaceae bacterium]|nr:alpha/beta hydrolase [Thermoleophilaceae bacterium]
ATWRSPALGERKVLELSGGRRIAYFEAGSGPAIVFVHGLLVNANLWRKVVERLSPDFRCIALDLPLGSHTLPMPAGTELGAPAIAGIVAGALDALELDDVTLVGNDSGGAISQIVVTTRPERVGKLVLTSCDYRDNFPPAMFAYFGPAARIPGAMAALLAPMRLAFVRHTPIAFGWLVKRTIDRRAEDSYVHPAIEDGEIRRDVKSFITGSSTEQTNRAADRLGEFDRPALIAWSGEDKLFPLADGESLAQDLPNSRLETVDDARTFSMEDNPGHLSELIAGFVREPAKAVA